MCFFNGYVPCVNFGNNYHDDIKCITYHIILEYTSLIHVTAFGIPPALWPLAYRPKAEDDESGPPTVHRSTVDLRVGAIDALHSLTEASDQSVFAVHALDPARITALLKTPPCDCGCRLPADILKKTCRSFWSLPKQSQDALLWNLQVGSGSSKRKWMIEGPIVKQGFCVRLTCFIIYKRYIYIYIYK